MRPASVLLLLTSSRNCSILRIKSGWVRRNCFLLSSLPVSSRVPSARMIRAEHSMRSELACTPQFIPEPLLHTMPPIMALFTDAGSGGSTRPNGFKMLFTRPPRSPGCMVMVLRSALTWYFSQLLPATIRTESLRLWPESDVPAARNVKGI